MVTSLEICSANFLSDVFICHGIFYGGLWEPLLWLSFPKMSNIIMKSTF